MRLFTKICGAASCALMLMVGSAQARDWKVIKEAGTVVVATEGQYYPFNYFDGPKLTGFEVELAEAVVKNMGLKIDWRVVSFDAQLASIRQDRFDFAIASHGFTEERAKAVDFANPHYCSGGQIVSLPGGPLTVAALKGKSVGVQIATTYFDAAKKLEGIGEIKTYKDEAANFAALKAKKYDAWISDKYLVKATLEKNPGTGATPGDMVFVERISMITRKNNKELVEQWNKSLAEVLKNGTYQALSTKYFQADIACH
ncbi:MAG: ABC transporter substrate-binding protein [Rhodoferax sp.]|uniref:ABC transporter substrate-binding protein n=1 Tax=Rhodoferax sp. TaxID=50421 RepID=UPI00301717FA